MHPRSRLPPGLSLSLSLSLVSIRLVLRHSCPFQSCLLFSLRLASVSSSFHSRRTPLVHTRRVRTRCSRHGAWVSTVYGGYIFHERRWGNDSAATLNSDVYRLKGRFHRDTDRQVQYRLFPCERTRSRIAVGAITERGPLSASSTSTTRTLPGSLWSLRYVTHTHTHTQTRTRAHVVCSYNINT